LFGYVHNASDRKYSEDLAFAAVHTRLAVARIFEHLDLTRDASKSVRTVTLKASRLVEADSAVLTRLTATVVPRVVLAQPAFDARRTHAHEVAADAARRTSRRRRPTCRTCSARYRRTAGSQLRRQGGGPVDLAQRSGEPSRTLTAEGRVAVRSGDDDTLGPVTTGQVEARIAQLARQAAVTARTHAQVADHRLGRPTRAVVEARVRHADAGDLLAAHTAVSRRADAAERAARSVVARGAVDARPTGARVMLVLTTVAAESSQTDADALPLLGQEARAAVETVLVIVARAVAAHVDE